jgi:hypothetical protein
VKFDITESKLGFILPTLIDARQGVNPHCDILNLVAKKGGSQQEAVRWNTRIDLPIKASISNGKGMASLAAKFDDIHPSLLLFLHRLRCIAVQNDVVSATKLMHREDLADGLVRVVHDKGHATWLVVRQQVLAGVPRPGIPLLDLPGGNYKASSEQQQVFAFLPLRSYGLRFIVQVLVFLYLLLPTCLIIYHMTINMSEFKYFLPNAAVNSPSVQLGFLFHRVILYYLRQEKR